MGTIPMHRSPALLPCLIALVTLLFSTASCHKRVVAAPLCDLSDNREEFANKIVRTKGWVYTSIVGFTLSDGKCTIGGRLPPPSAPSHRFFRFINLLRTAPKGAFNTDGDLFATLEGRFLTQATKIGKIDWTPGYGRGQSPTVLVIEDVVCSGVAPISRNTEAQALSHCE
jgi:hypothetical protein